MSLGMVGSTDMNSSDGKKAAKRQPMRSSIACLRCRKSKIKCDNDGKAISPCVTCIKTGKECRYPDFTAQVPKRADSVSAGTKRDGDAGPDSRKRLKRLDDIPSWGDSPSSGAQHAEEVLSAHYLTETLWNQVFHIFRLHFATELPFLHLPTLKERMASRFHNTNNESAKDTPADTNLVLLGVLTLTARFHPDLVKYVIHGVAASQGGNAKTRPLQSNPDSSAASEYFRDALTKSLGPLRITMTEASVERVQAFLMLGLFEWNQIRPQTGGLGAWMYVGVAIRMAQALGLGFGDRPELGSRKFSTQRNKDGQNLSHESLIVAKEVNRRTMFSCYILDRMLSCGRERVSTIHSEDLHVQLPCSEVQFDMSDEAQTGFLRPLPGEQATHITKSDSVLARFIRLVDIWGDVSKFSFAGGRLTEKLPPWKETRFRHLQMELDEFYSDLPAAFTFSTKNYRRHENHLDSSVYISLHMLGCVCRIMLNREYIPFIPIRCTKPSGPLDEPTFPNDIDNSFWEESAEKVFKSARDIVELIEICQKSDKLPMSALTLFAVWTAAFVGIYSWHFPQMDTKRHMLGSDYHPGLSSSDITKSGPTSVAFEALNKMSAWLRMASTYVQYFHDMGCFYDRVKYDYHRHANSNKGTPANGQKASSYPPAHAGDDKRSIRRGGSGGGLDEWHHHSSKIINNGLILGEDHHARHLPGGHGHHHREGSDFSRGSTIERSSSIGPADVDRPRTSMSTPSTGFTAINREVMQSPGSSTTTAAHDPHQQPQYRYDGQPSHPPPPGWSRVAPLQTPYLQSSSGRTPLPSSASYISNPDNHSHAHFTPAAATPPPPPPPQPAETFYDAGDPSAVVSYLTANEGLRWQHAGNAADIGMFSHGDPTGPALFPFEEGEMAAAAGMVGMLGMSLGGGYGMGEMG